MPRIRTIKPEFWRNRQLAMLPDFTRLVAIAILNLADDEGFFEADTMLIRGDVFPYLEDYGSITVALRELSDVGYVAVKPTSEKGLIGRVANFRKHQVINKPTPSKLRVFFEKTDATGQLPEDYGSTTVALPPGTGNREQGKEQGEGKEALPPTLEEVTAECAKKNYRTVDPARWWSYWDSVSWTDKNGRLIKWQSRLMNDVLTPKPAWMIAAEKAAEEESKPSRYELYTKD